MSSDLTLTEIFDNQTNFLEKMAGFVVSTVAADSLAPLGGRASAGTVRTKSGCLMEFGIVFCPDSDFHGPFKPKICAHFYA